MYIHKCVLLVGSSPCHVWSVQVRISVQDFSRSQVKQEKPVQALAFVRLPSPLLSIPLLAGLTKQHAMGQFKFRVRVEEEEVALLLMAVLLPYFFGLRIFLFSISRVPS